MAPPLRILEKIIWQPKPDKELLKILKIELNSLAINWFHVWIKWKALISETKSTTYYEKQQPDDFRQVYVKKPNLLSIYKKHF